jgi:hypothetical protein
MKDLPVAGMNFDGGYIGAIRQIQWENETLVDVLSLCWD